MHLKLCDVSSIPEFSALSARERRTIWFHVFFRAWHHWLTWAAFSFNALCIAVGAEIIYAIFRESFFGILLALPFVYVGYVVFERTHECIAKPYIYEELSKRK